jgi:hypothetical protein
VLAHGLIGLQAQLGEDARHARSLIAIAALRVVACVIVEVPKGRQARGLG